MGAEPLVNSVTQLQHAGPVRLYGTVQRADEAHRIDRRQLKALFCKYQELYFGNEVVRSDKLESLRSAGTTRKCLVRPS